MNKRIICLLIGLASLFTLAEEVKGVSIPVVETKQSTLNWTISYNSTCSSINPGCECSKSPNSNVWTIICRCQEENQVVNLQGGRTKEDKEVSWRIENCNTVFIEPNALAAFGRARFIFELYNISKMILKEDSFKLPEGETLDKSIIFNKCNIPDIPAKVFPSSLIVKFINSVVGKISSGSFRLYYMPEIIFENSTVEAIEANAFSDKTRIDIWTVINSHMGRMETNAIESSITTMNWSDSKIDKMDMHCLTSVTGVIANAIFKRTHFTLIENNGIAIRDWSRISFINNTFGKVKKYGIDLSQHSTSTEYLADFIGNEWDGVEPDFIFPGKSEKWDSQYFTSRNNTFTMECECSKSISSLFTISESSDWFQGEILNSSRCSINNKSATCFDLEEPFLDYESLPLLCSSELYMCINKLDDVTTTFPQTHNRLYILIILIAVIVGLIVFFLIAICICVCLRGKPPHPHKKTSITQPLDGTEDCILYKKPPQEGSSKSSTIRPRSTLLDQESGTEDKGVQTMPNDLSTDIQEMLRERLKEKDREPWYDLIHVKEKLVVTSPPDVTILCHSANSSSSSPNGNNHSPPNNRNNRSTSMTCPTPPFLNTKIPISKSVNNMNAKYAQIRPKQKTTFISEYRDPSDSHQHIYSELSSGQRERPNVPLVCEYAEPQDVQSHPSHVYSELVEVRSNGPGSGRTCFFPKNKTQSKGNSTWSNCQRPLPSIPPKPQSSQII